MKLKWVGTWDAVQRKFRVLRLMWTQGTVGDGYGYSVKLSLALRPALFSFNRDCRGFFTTVLGLQVHYQRDYGGIHV